MKNNINRRSFLTRTGLATAGSLFVPNFLKAFDQQSTPLNSERKLIVIQWSGGNDGLNCIVPYKNNLYYEARPTIAIDSKKVLPLTDDLGLNPKLSFLRKLYDQGEISIVNNVGYPDPDRSHFRSMDIWQTASNADEFLSSGWLGRFVDAHAATNHYAIELDDTLSLALKGDTKSGFAMSNPRQLHQTTNNELIQAIQKHHHSHEHDEKVAYLYQTLSNTVSSADYIFEKSKTYKTKQNYPKGALGKQMKQVAELIIGGCDTQVYYVNFSGFDTHVNQTNKQDRLLEEYSNALEALVNDLKKNGFWDDTLIMNFSEFGRRVAENGSRGTDHGQANNVYLMSGKIKKAGFYNTAPDLVNLSKGDLKYEVDFRNIYATVLQDWLQTNDQSILGRPFDSLNGIL